MDGHDEVEAGENRGESVDEDTQDRRSNRGIRIHTAERRVERPASVQSARAEGIQNEASSDDVDVPAQQIDLREGQILRADHQGDQEIPEDRGDRGDQEEENHGHAVHGEELVVSFRCDQRSAGGQEMDANHGGQHAANEKENCDGGQIKQGNALVVGG